MTTYAARRRVSDSKHARPDRFLAVLAAPLNAAAAPAPSSDSQRRALGLPSTRGEPSPATNLEPGFITLSLCIFGEWQCCPCATDQSKVEPTAAIGVNPSGCIAMHTSAARERGATREEDRRSARRRHLRQCRRGRCLFHPRDRRIRGRRRNQPQHLSTAHDRRSPSGALAPPSRSRPTRSQLVARRGRHPRQVLNRRFSCSCPASVVVVSRPRRRPHRSSGGLCLFKYLFTIFALTLGISHVAATWR